MLVRLTRSSARAQWCSKSVPSPFRLAHVTQLQKCRNHSLADGTQDLRTKAWIVAGDLIAPEGMRDDELDAQPLTSNFLTMGDGDGLGAELEESEQDLESAGVVENAHAARRRQLMEDAAIDNPFIAAQMIGGVPGAAEVAIKRHMQLGYMDNLAGAGKPFAKKPLPPPFVAREDEKILEIVDRLSHERADLPKGEWKEAVAKSHVNDMAKSTMGDKGGVR